MISTILFDLDGTLADTAGDFVEVINIMRKRRGGLAPFMPEVITPWVSKGSRAMINANVPIPLPPSNMDQALDEFHQLYAAQKHIETRPFPGVDEMLEQITKKGYTWGIVTNKYRSLTLPLLEDLHLEPKIVLCGDDVEKAKPDPTGLKLAASMLSVPVYECVYVGDAERDILAAKHAGMQSVIAGWGYIAEWENEDDWGADGYAETPRELFDALK